MITLLGRTSSINVRKVLWTLHELGLPFRQEAYGSGHAPTDTPAFRALNPNSLVPVLVDGDFVLWESNTVCRYLAARERREDLLPAAPQPRARVEQWMDWQATELNGAWRVAFMALMRGNPQRHAAADVAASAAAWNRQMAVLERQLERTGAHVAGPDFTLADVVLGLSLHRWLATPIERPAPAELPALAAYHARLQGRAGFRAVATAEWP